MIMTEKEASKKSCVNWANVSDNIDFTPCTGSGCMAWRWSGYELETKIFDKEWHYSRLSCAPSARTDGWKYNVSLSDDKHEYTRLKPDAEATGYCGLAGKS